MKIFLFIALLTLSFLAGCQNEVKSSEQYEISDLSSSVDYEIARSHQELKERSDLAAKVTLLEDKGTYEIDGYPIGSKSEVKVMESSDHSIEKGQMITVVEPSYFEDEQYIQTEGYIKMRNNREYILYLMKGEEEESQYYGIVSLGFGKYSAESPGATMNLQDFNSFGDLDNYEFIDESEETVNHYNDLRSNVLEAWNNSSE